MARAERRSKTQLAQKLGVSRSSLYYRHKMPAKVEALREQIETVMAENPGYGSSRVAIALGINEKHAARVMRKFKLKPARRAKAPHKPMDKGRCASEAPERRQAAIADCSERYLGQRSYVYSIPRLLCLPGYGSGLVHR